MFFDTRHHLLYDVEDYTRCPQDEQMSLSMAYRAYVQGCRFIMVTPPASAFLNAEAKGIPLRMRFDSLRREIRRYLPDMELGLGCELECSRDNVDELIQHLKAGRLPTLNGSHWVLVSFADTIMREELWFCLERLDQAGYHPVLCHAQSIQSLKYDIQEMQELRNAENRFPCLIQLDTLSLHHFSSDRDWARKMIEHRVVDVLGTDARNTFTNPPHILEELQFITEICDDPIYLAAISEGNGKQHFQKEGS